MIRDDFRRGSGLPSSDWHNAVARAANQAADLKKSSHNHVATNNNVLSGQVAIHIKNCTGRFLPRLSVVSVCYPMGQDGGTGRIAGHPVNIRDFVLNQGIIYEGWVPTDTEDTWTPAITLSDLYPGEINKAVIMGIVPCLVDIQSDTHGFADIIPGNTDMLQSVEEGKIRIIKQSLPRDRNPDGVQPVDVLLGFSEGGGCTGHTPSNSRIRLVQRKELFPACEYKTLQNVHGCTLEYSDDNVDWTVSNTFNIVGGRMTCTFNNPSPDPHRYWRINLRGFALPEDPDDSNADRGFFTFGRLWSARFNVETEDDREPTYRLTPNDATVAINEPPDTEITAPWDSKPVPRKSGNHRIWQLTFDQPEIVTQVILDVDRHNEHYIVCPGGRDANKQDVRFIYSFDLATEKWTATTFPELQRPMYNMDAKVVELEDGTHQLVILSGQIASGFSNVIQGYNFERDYINNAVDMGEGAINFAGRPALAGNPMLRGMPQNRPQGEWDFTRSLMVVGGSSHSTRLRAPTGIATAVHDSVLFFVQASLLALGVPYENTTTGVNVTVGGHTGLPFGRFDVTSQAGQAGPVGLKLQNLQTYTRHQNLPVRGILRRRPNDSTVASASNRVIDFLLIGGFNQVGREEYNRKVVSGIFFNGFGGANFYHMLIDNPHFWNAWNTDWMPYYPDTQYALGDCCAEYVEERDEIICFGGRAHQSDTAVAHATPATLVFTPGSNSATWDYARYPQQPNPRWSAASVLIRGLQRKGETTAHDRIFIIGGRNRDGFVAEVDVFNLSTDTWETDWPGLDDGELEAIPPSMGGGGATIIIQGGAALTWG